MWLFIVFCICIMFGCAKKEPVENAFQDVQTSIIAVKDSLPKECQTEIVMAKIGELESKKEVAESVCAAKIKDVQTKYERCLWVFFVLILAFFVKIFVKYKKII